MLFGLKIIVTVYWLRLENEYLNADLVKNLLTVNLIQVIHSLSNFFRENNEMGLNFGQVYRVCFVIICSSIITTSTSFSFGET